MDSHRPPQGRIARPVGRLLETNLFDFGSCAAAGPGYDSSSWVDGESLGRCIGTRKSAKVISQLPAEVGENAGNDHLSIHLRRRSKDFGMETPPRRTARA